MAGEVNVLVACGGSGIRTLRRVNELMSQDSYWRRRLATDIYYVIVDTDLEEMREFEQSVMQDLAGVPDKPYIVAFPLSRGETHLQPLVNQHFVKPFEGGRNEAGRDRLLDHWWNLGPDRPFLAPNVTNVTKGAGQCPPVSYFLTWKNLESMEGAFRKLIEAIQRRKSGFGRLDQLNFIIVAGVAGGTGRGSWELIAFKMRELFAKYGQPPTPRAFLFDSSVFGDVYESVPDQRVPMRVNALTGMSQLSCWISNKKEGHDNPKAVLPYRLPSMVNPEEPDADLLQVDLDLDVNNAAPVNHAYLIFDTNGVAHLADHFQYCEMAGAGIYAALSKSSILRQAINSAYAYVGLATAAYDVNAATIRRYFEAQARVQATKMLIDVDVPAIQEKVNEFFKKTHLYIDITDDDPATFFRSDPNGFFLQRVLTKLDDKSRGKIAAVTQALEKDDVEETRRMVRAAMLKNESLVRSCFDETIRDERLNPCAVAESMAKELFEQTQSLGNVKLFLEMLQAGLAEELDEMPAAMPWGRDEPTKLVEEFATRPFPLIYPYFNAAERKKLVEVTRRGVGTANYDALKQDVEEIYKQWSREIDRLRANADDLIKCVQTLERKFSKERENTVPGHEDAFPHLFTDPDRPEKGLPDRFSAKKFYRRELKPALASGEDLKMLGDQVNVSKELSATIDESLTQARNFSQIDSYDVRKRLEKRLEQVLRETVGLRDTFIIENFSMRRVIHKLIDVWRARLQKQMSWEERGHLEDHFQEFFGFIPERRQDGNETVYEFPDLDDFILNMAASLAKNCKPYWMLTGRKGHDFKVALFVPTEKGKEAAEQRVAEYLNDDSIKPEVYAELQTSELTSRTTANPFLLLAYSTQGADKLDDIDSLRYFTESGVYDLIRGTEDPNGETIFKGARNGGIGYVDPLYVRNEDVRQLRWRPWADKTSAQQLEEQQAIDALLYALFPGDDIQAGPLQDVLAKLQGIGWGMPLIKNKGRNRYVFTRLPLEHVDGKVRTDQQTQNLNGWDEDKPVAPVAGLVNVFAALQTAVDKDRQAWKQRILSESETFWDTILREVNLARGTPNFREMMNQYSEWLGASSRAAEENDPSRVVWGRMLSRVKELVES